jgi:hypothetical protein
MIAGVETAAPPKAEDLVLFVRASLTDLNGVQRRAVQPTISDVWGLLGEIAETEGRADHAARRELLSQTPPGARTGIDEIVHRAAVDTYVRRMRLGSPLEIAVGISGLIIKSAEALGLVIYVAKQVWTVDLDLRTKRAESHVKLGEAQQIARQARKGNPPASWPESGNFGPRHDRYSFGPVYRRWDASEAVIIDWEDLDWD